MRRLLACAVVALLFQGLAHAHWTRHPELPDWAQRGKLHWCLHYSRADQERVDLFLDGGQNFVHGGNFDSAETAAYALENGMRYMPYVCSRTTTVSEIEKNPQLKDAVVLNSDREEVLAYNNPARRYGSLFMPAWPEFVRERTRQQRTQPGALAIFYDNAFWTVDDHRDTAVDAWQRWARQRGIEPGDDVPSVSSGLLAAASKAFVADSLVKYHAGLHDFCHSQEPPLLTSPNESGLASSGLMTTEAGATDLIFSETMSHPPFVNNTFLYKQGLAASHGKPTGLLAYLPPDIAAQRGVKTWHEGMHHFFYPSSPLPEEFALAAAEGASCGGTYIPNYSLFPSLPITDTTDPFCKRVHREIKRSYTFINANEDLYAEAQPGSNVAIYYCSSTDLQGRRLQNAPALAQAVTDAGIPYEVVVSDDIVGGSLAGIGTLVVANATYIDETVVEGILRFVEDGGRLVLTGDFAGYDAVGRPLVSPAANAIRKSLRLVSTPIREWQLDGFEAEGESHVMVSQTEGKASLVFDGAPGSYTAHIMIQDENDGTSDFSLSVDGRAVYVGTLDVEDNDWHWRQTPAFQLAAGSRVELTVKADGGERGRVSSVVLVGADSGGGASLGSGSVVYSPVALETLAGQRLVEVLKPGCRLLDGAKLTANMMTVPQQNLRLVHLVNYDFQYEVKTEGLYASDDGSPDVRMFFGTNSTVVRKRIRIDSPAELGKPVLQVHGFAVAGCMAELSVRVNGKEAGRIAAQDMLRRGWAELPLAPGLLTELNTIEIGVEGEVDGQTRWVQIDIDRDTDQGNSEFSTDGGATFTRDDLSTDRKAQTGEYMIRIQDTAPGGEEQDPENLVNNPGFENVDVPHSGTKLAVSAASGATVLIPGEQPEPCLAISPDGPPVWVEGEIRDGAAAYPVPDVGIYTVLALGPSRERLEALRQAQMNASSWTLPEVTEPLREQTIGWNPYGEGFTTARDTARTGQRSLYCSSGDTDSARGAVQVITPPADRAQKITVSAWSRCEDVSGDRDGHYSVYVDATLNDGTAYHGYRAAFDSGTHDWQEAKMVLTPPKPIASMLVYVLFRKHSGQAWFDDVRVVVE